VLTQPSVRIGPAPSIKPLILTSNRVFNSVIVRLKRNIYFGNDINLVPEASDIVQYGWREGGPMA
jgi:hypothetical protein